MTSPTETTERDDEPGRFIARCATEADGGTPGMTFFTDGSQNVTDHCLSRYYIGVQPAPGALYVPDDQAGRDAPDRDTPTTQTSAPEWTLAQPRSDAGPSDGDAGVTDESDESDEDLNGGLELIADEDDQTTDLPDSTDDPDTPVTDDPGTTTPTTPPGETTTPTTPPTPTSPGAPDADEPASGEQSDPSGSGSAAPGEPSTVPTGNEAQLPNQSPPATSADPWGSLGSTGPQGSANPQGSGDPQASVVMPGALPDLQWPAPALPGS